MFLGGLTGEDYEFCGRQIALPQIGSEGQAKLKSARIAVVGAGGLGSPAILYLAGAGIGYLKIIDGDVVETSNLHRQIIHSNYARGENKAINAGKEASARNPHIKVECIPERLNGTNAIFLLSDVDLVLDCTDNPEARYLINDVCVVKGTPNVSASAIRWEGQLSVYNGPLANGNRSCCYRCLFPVPPTVNVVGSCDVEGVVGPAPGIMGTLQAAEAIKVLLDLETLAGKMLLMNLLNLPMFRTIKLRAKCCTVCKEGVFKPVQFQCPDTVTAEIPEEANIEVSEFVAKYFDNGKVKTDVVFLDVRPKNHFAGVHLPGAENVPANEFLDETFLKDWVARHADRNKIFVSCRRGRQSKIVTKKLLECVPKRVNVFNVVGGLAGFARLGLLPFL